MARHTVPPPTKEIFIPVTKATDLTTLGDHVGGLINASGENAIIEFMVPHDFHSLVAAELVIIGVATFTGRNLAVTTDFGGHGEAYNVHSDSVTLSWNDTANQVTRLDISTALDGLAALDHVGLTATYVTNTNDMVLGVRLRYT